MGKVISIIKKEKASVTPDRFGHVARSLSACVLVLMFAVICVNGLMGMVFTHAVSIDPNFGTGIVDTFTVTQGSKVTLPIPERPFYTFAGWYEDEELTKPFDTTSDTVHKSMTLFGKWRRNTYTISFVDPRLIGNEKNGVIAEITQEFGTGFYFPTPSDATESNFSGWSFYMRGKAYPNSNNPQKLFAQLEQNTTFYAAWEYDFWAYERPTISIAQPLKVRFNFQKDFPDVFYYDQSSAVTSQFEEKTISSMQSIDLPTMLGVTAMNNGYTTNSFGFWSLLPGTASTLPKDAPTFRDGQTVTLGSWIDYAVDGVLEFYSIWI